MKQENSKNSIVDLITSRRTIHDFKMEPVPSPEILKQAIDISRWAPNHHLTEPWHIYLLGKETVSAVVELNTELIRQNDGEEAAAAKKARWSAIPGWFVVTCDRSSDDLRQQEDYAACCCMIQNILLFLWNVGIGVKWSTGKIIRDKHFYDLLWIDADAEFVVGIFWYGYAAEIPVMTRNPVEQIIIDLP